MTFALGALLSLGFLISYPLQSQAADEESSSQTTELDALRRELRRAIKADPMGLGKTVYRRACRPCHGERGDGRSPAARYLDPRPRDLTRGEFKFRSTPSGSLPTDDDLERTILAGVPQSDMPPFRGRLNDAELEAVVVYIKHFSPAFAQRQPEEPVLIPPRLDQTPESIANGRIIYEQLRCGTCHGASGRGDGPAADTLRDDEGQPIRAYDFTTGYYKGGGKPEDIYRTVVTGLTGTPMPSYAGTVSPEEMWDLVYFILSLERPDSLWQWLLERPGPHTKRLEKYIRSYVHVHHYDYVHDSELAGELADHRCG